MPSEAPWYEDGPPLEAVTPIEEAWARQLCVEDYGKPDELIGLPKLPRWRSWLTAARRAIRAAESLGYKPDVSC